MRDATPNPLARMALDTPPTLSAAISIAARLAGVAFALHIANDQSYDRTQIFATGLAAFALLSLVPSPPVAQPAFAAFAAGVLFFSGAALLDQAAGVAMLIAGVLAAIGVMVAAQRGGARLLTPVIAFFGSLPLLVAAIAAIALAVEG